MWLADDYSLKVLPQYLQAGKTLYLCVFRAYLLYFSRISSSRQPASAWESTVYKSSGGEGT
jgi:hypothetical protein